MTHLNRIQQLCTNLEAEPEFVMGHVYGMRQWSLRESQDGPHLYGHNDFAWSLDQTNQATCGLFHWTSHLNLAVSEYVAGSYYPVDRALERSARQLFNENPGSYVAHITLEGSGTVMVVHRDSIMDRMQVQFPWSLTRDFHGSYIDGRPNPHSYQGVLRFRLQVTVPVAPHDVTDPRCTCGFYAYTDLESLYENSRMGKSRYFGIVKAWGRVTQGTKGFRAEKTQIVGLTPAMNRETISAVLKEIGAQTVDIKFNPDGSATLPYDNGGIMPGPVLQRWVPADSPSPLEAQLIPADFPRYSNMGEMFTAYQRLTEDDRR